jgi:hypothetical protein
VELNLGLPTNSPVVGLSNSGAKAMEENGKQNTNGLENGDVNNNNVDRQNDRNSSFVCINNNNNTGTTGVDEDNCGE